MSADLSADTAVPSQKLKSGSPEDRSEESKNSKRAKSSQRFASVSKSDSGAHEKSKRNPSHIRYAPRKE